MLIIQKHGETDIGFSKKNFPIVKAGKRNFYNRILNNLTYIFIVFVAQKINVKKRIELQYVLLFLILFFSQPFAL